MRILILSFFLLAACKVQHYTVYNTPEDLNPQTNAKNIILLIGDGMGLSQVSSAIYMNNNRFAIERFPVVGLHKNYATNNLVTDSAAGATAFSCGVKSYNGAIGVDADTIAHETILEELHKLKYKTGLVASSSIVHATPASFAAHNESRTNYEQIAYDMVDSGTDIMIGGGKGYFDRRDSDTLNLYNSLSNLGYEVTDYFSQDIQDCKFIDGKYVHFTADKEPLTVQAGRDYLPLASKMAVDYLDRNSKDNGFFIMIEGSQIDWAGHANDFSYLIAEMNDYEQVIHMALDFAKKDGETLVILTADHETGGLAINPGSKMNEINPAYTSDYHTAALIPVYAYGPGAELFSGIYENTAIYHKMRTALGLNRE